MTIAVDAMGGDQGPGAVVSGALASLVRGPATLRIVLVGDPRVLDGELARCPASVSHRISIEAADGVVAMEESPGSALRRTTPSSIHVVADLHARGLADALVSPGNTGAVMAICRHRLGAVPGIERPAIAACLPRPGGACLVLDVGANVKCTSDQLVGFAAMGSVYAQRVLGRDRPVVGLLSIGEEAEKGTPEIRAAHRRLSQAPIEFAGNVEGRDLLRPGVDVVVCDGFVGNVLLKFAEGAFGMVAQRFDAMTKDSWRGRMARGLLGHRLAGLTTDLDPDTHGGAPLLGLAGAAIICHGNAGPGAIEEAIFAAVRYGSLNVNEEICELLGRIAPPGAGAQPE